MTDEIKVHYARFTGDIHKTSYGYWMALVSLFIDKRKLRVSRNNAKVLN